MFQQDKYLLRFSGSPALWACNSFCVATAHCTASTTLAYSANRLSPGESSTPAAVLFDEVVEGLFVGFESFDSCRLVVLHQATVTGDIGAENGGELAVKAFLFHADTSLARRFGKS
jgi:hypothetical protein